MIVLHALWSLADELCVWGERSAMPARSRRPPGRPSRTPGPPTHPFCCPAPSLRETLARVGVEAVGAYGRRVALALPASDRRPRELAAAAASDRRRRAAGLGARPRGLEGRRARAAHDVGGRPGAGAVVAGARWGSVRRFAPLPGGSVEARARTGRRGRLRPGLERHGESWIARWRPVLDDASDAERIETLAWRCRRSCAPSSLAPSRATHRGRCWTDSSRPPSTPVRVRSCRGGSEPTASRSRSRRDPRGMAAGAGRRGSRGRGRCVGAGRAVRADRGVVVRGPALWRATDVPHVLPPRAAGRRRPG